MNLPKMNEILSKINVSVLLDARTELSSFYDSNSKIEDKIIVDWDKYAEQYDAITMSGSNPAYIELVNLVHNYFTQETQIKDDSLIADLGGGTGNFTMKLAESYPNSRFVIVDMSPRMLELAKEKANKKGLKNIDTLLIDVENISLINEIYSRPLTHAIMIHSLYTTGNYTDEKPQNILKNINNGLEPKNSKFFISDINRKIKTGNWIPYCLWNSLKTNNYSIGKTLNFFKENDQAKLANKHIDSMQLQNKYLLCNLDQFKELLYSSGFKNIYKESNQFYRGRDNLIVCGN